MIDFYVDADGDGFGDANQVVQACVPAFGISQLSDDCDDANASISPIADEICDGIDNNCDGDTDEDLMQTFYRDQDEDGFGNPSDTIESCAQPSGYVPDNTDCDDLESYAHPDMTEVCDGIDNDCDGDIDSGSLDAQEYFTDNDGDGYGDSAQSTFACAQPSIHLLLAMTAMIHRPVFIPKTSKFAMALIMTATEVLMKVVLSMR